jgi:hypothetical protein
LPSPYILHIHIRMLHTCRMAQVDLYTCFPIAAQAAAREFGLNSTDGRKMTLIGGLMYLSSQCICIGSLSVPLCVSLCTSVRLCVTHRLAGAGTTAGLVRTQRCIRWRQWCQSCAGQQVPTVRLFLCVSLCLSVSLCVSLCVLERLVFSDMCRQPQHIQSY